LKRKWIENKTTGTILGIRIRGYDMKDYRIVKEAIDEFVDELENNELWLEKVDCCSNKLYEIVGRIVRTALNKKINSSNNRVNKE